MSSLRWIPGAVLCVVTSLAPVPAHSQNQHARALVRSIVTSELAADASDHSRWMFRDANKVRGNSTVKLTVQTAQGDLSKTIEMDGRPLTSQEQRDDEQKMQQFVTDPSIRQKQKHDEQQDDQKAASLTKMLPDAFLWTQTGKSNAETTLAFKPDPKFHPPTREARVFAAMEGTMVVNTKQRRIKSLKGTLTKNVDFGSGLLGKLEKGGTFDVGRQQIGPRIWEITTTHIHIQGHALIFKSISEEQDEETSHYKPAPRSITLTDAAKKLNDGTVSKQLGISNPQ
jgi:hypothetical protein